jgi:hypothetical protein
MYFVRHSLRGREKETRRPRLKTLSLLEAEAAEVANDFVPFTTLCQVASSYHCLRICPVAGFYRFLIGACELARLLRIGAMDRMTTGSRFRGRSYGSVSRPVLMLPTSCIGPSYGRCASGELYRLEFVSVLIDGLTASGGEQMEKFGSASWERTLRW